MYILEEKTIKTIDNKDTLYIRAIGTSLDEKPLDVAGGSEFTETDHADGAIKYLFDEASKLWVPQPKEGGGGGGGGDADGNNYYAVKTTLVKADDKIVDMTVSLNCSIDKGITWSDDRANGSLELTAGDGIEFVDNGVEGKKQKIEIKSISSDIPSVDDIDDLPVDKWTLYTGEENIEDGYYPGNFYLKNSATGTIIHGDKRTEPAIIEIDHNNDGSWHYKLNDQEGLFTDGLDTLWDYLIGYSQGENHTPLTVVRYYDASTPLLLRDSKKYNAVYNDLNLTDVYVDYEDFKLHLTKAGTVIHCEVIPGSSSEIPVATTEALGGIKLFADTEIVPESGNPVKLDENGKAYTKSEQSVAANVFKFGYDPDNPVQTTWVTPNELKSENIIASLYDQHNTQVLADITVTQDNVYVSFDKPLNEGDKFTLVYSANASGALPHIYQHFWGVQKSATEPEMILHFNILSSSSTMTVAEMKQWLYSNGFNSDTNHYPCYGVVSTRQGLFCAEHSGGATDVNFSITNMASYIYSTGSALRYQYFNLDSAVDDSLIKLMKTVKII